MRSLVRETVFKTIFSKLFNSNDEGLFDVLIKDFSDDDKDFANSLYNAVIENYQNAVEIINENATKFKFDRLYNVDKCILILGITELDYFKQTSTSIIINEVVNLAAKYSTENSIGFINGFLAKYAKDR